MHKVITLWTNGHKQYMVLYNSFWTDFDALQLITLTSIARCWYSSPLNPFLLGIGL